MDIATFGAHFIKLELPSCALSCFLLIPQSDVRKRHIDDLLSSKCHIEVLKQLSDLKSRGKTVPLADQVKYFHSLTRIF